MKMMLVWPISLWANRCRLTKLPASHRFSVGDMIGGFQSSFTAAPMGTAASVHNLAIVAKALLGI